MTYGFTWRAVGGATLVAVAFLATAHQAAAAGCKSAPACALAARNAGHPPAALGAAAGSAVGHVLATKQQHQPPHKPFRTYQLPPRAALLGG